jgi:hypothetical protein
MYSTHDEIEARRAVLHAAERTARANYDDVAVAGRPLRGTDTAIQHLPLLRELQAKLQQATAERKAFDREHPVQKKTGSN